MIRMPAPNADIISRHSEITQELYRCVGDPAAVIVKENDLISFECDGLPAYRQRPLAVVLPESTAEVSALLRYCSSVGVPVVARGAGTSLSGGALPLADGIVIGVSRMKQVLRVDPDNRLAVVQAGVTNLAVTDAVAPHGFFYAPDPSSQLACTLAGNVAMNSGGAHCLKYGVTTNNVLGMKMVLANGECLDLGGDHLESGGLDLLGLAIGSEGTFGIVTEVTVRILPMAEGARPVLLGFESVRDAGNCVGAIIASGVIPVALEFMDKPAILACESFAGAGYPTDSEAMLIIEVEGAEAEIDVQLSRIVETAKAFHPTTIKTSESERQSVAIWRGRKSAFGAMGQVCPDYLCMDGVIPTGRIAEVLEGIGHISQTYNLKVANIFHAGDGNLHPLILYDASKDGELERVESMGADILKLCVEVGGCLTGEHGVGIEKRDLMSVQFSAADITQQKRLQSVFDPKGLLNPGKLFPLDSDQARSDAYS